MSIEPRAAFVILAVVAACSRPETPGRQDPPHAGAEDRPHVVLISVDTLRRDHLPIYGYGRDTAPELSRLAENAVVFEEAVAAQVNTAPSHASVFTGLYPLTHGLRDNGWRLAVGVRTLAQSLYDLGYETAGFVSSFALNGEVTDLRRGFRHYDDVDYATAQRQADETLAAVRRWLANYDGNRPLFLFVHFYDPHYPYDAPESYGRRFREAQGDYRFPAQLDRNRIRANGPESGELREYVDRYDGEIAFVDAHVGELLSDLTRGGWYDESLIVFLSDHGETLDERGWVFDHGGRVYEEQVRIPLLIRFPHGARSGRSARPAHHVDVAPTVLSSIGRPVPDGMQGESLLDDPRRGSEPRPFFSLGRCWPHRLDESIPGLVRRGTIFSIRVAPWKLIAYPTEGSAVFRLHQFATDPLERYDVSSTHPEVLDRLRRQLEEWREASGRPAEEPALSDEVVEGLRTLGYVQ